MWHQVIGLERLGEQIMEPCAAFGTCRVVGCLILGDGVQTFPCNPSMALTEVEQLGLREQDRALPSSDPDPLLGRVLTARRDPITEIAVPPRFPVAPIRGQDCQLEEPIELVRPVGVAHRDRFDRPRGDHEIRDRIRVVACEQDGSL
jgi:hypothetical protein